MSSCWSSQINNIICSIVKIYLFQTFTAKAICKAAIPDYHQIFCMFYRDYGNEIHRKNHHLYFDLNGIRHANFC